MRAQSLATRVIVMAVAVVSVLFRPIPAGLEAQGTEPAALNGVVSSQEEGNMEGVVVTARRDGANFTVSVVSDAQGRYSFPSTHVAPGSYALTMRAAGYDLVSPGPVAVAAGQAASVDLTLQTTTDLASQLTSIDWAMSMPGTTELKDKLVYQAASCAYCHSYQRMMKSKHTAEEWVPVISRMQAYYPDGTSAPDERRGRAVKGSAASAARAEKNPNWGSVSKIELGQYLATVNLSGGRTTWPFELKTLPRPKGKGTRVIITQYDQPRRDTVSHDMELDSKGTPWYTDQSKMYIGKLDPKTGTFTEYPLPPVPGRPGGASDIVVDNDDNLWFPMTSVKSPSTFGFPTRFDTKTETLTPVELPNNASVQFMAVGPDGRIWGNAPGRGLTVRIDPKTLKVDSFNTRLPDNAPPGGHSYYQVQVNSQGNPYLTDFGGSNILGIDTKTGASTFYPTPTPNSFPRRGRMDTQDRLWFAEYYGDKIAFFDTRAERFEEFAVPYKYTTPYTVSVPDKNGRVYASSNMSDRVLRLDPKTREVIEYLMPTQLDSKKIAIDQTTAGVTVWMANTRTARILKIEPLD